ncbi:hypothetical protein [Clostridium sp. KNHs214]|uniref:hypothetical protein n=1 Tax=Clostridium sp. KNHs214 TaxID=1540257 RepID=UPI000555497B|nr:hypothetical protein [Clostridium sp. KNHs214]
MKNLRMTKWELLDKEQKELGMELKELLQKKYDRVEILQTNLGFETFSRGIGVNIYTNKYDYKEINLKYPCDATVKDYYKTVVYAIECEEWHREHNSSPEERFIIDLLENHGCKDMLVVFDELRSFKCDDTIAVDYISKISFDSETKQLEIKEENEGVFIVDLNEETIEIIKCFDDEGESFEQDKKQCKLDKIDQKEKDYRKEHIRICPNCGSEMTNMHPNGAGIEELGNFHCYYCGYDEAIIDNELIKDIIREFNKLNYWCELAFLEDTEIIYIHDKESDNEDDLGELVAKDDITEIQLKDNKLTICFDEDKNGFTGLIINEYGIEY